LFIGNSYTYENNLGDILSGIAAADPEGPIIVPVLATTGGATLKWHLENGSALKRLQGRWTRVSRGMTADCSDEPVNTFIQYDPAVTPMFAQPRSWPARRPKVHHDATQC
jgi:hypothetical protein